MHLEYSEEQRTLAKALRAELADGAAAPPDRGGRPDRPDRSDSPDPHAPLGSLDRLVPYGLYGLEVPGADGGLELGIAVSAIVCEELGRAAAADQYRATTLLADLLAHTGQRDLLSALAKGEVSAQLATADPPLRSRHDRGRILLRGRCDVPGGRADGLPMLIAPSMSVDDGIDDGPISLAAFSVQGLLIDGCSSSPGFEIESAVSVATAPLTEADRPSGIVIRARIRQAAYLLGLAEGAHELARRWAARREQFGTAIGENQAIAFPLARQKADIEAARMLLHQACWLSDRNGDAVLAATQSLAYAAELALDTTTSSVHVHGAFGLTRRSAVHRYYETAAVEAVRWGSPDLLWIQAGELRSSG